MKILNLTQHLATKEQLNAGVIDLPEAGRQDLIRLLTFDELPSSSEVQQRAAQIAGEAKRFIEENDIDIDAAMIGGAPYLMAPMERYLKGDGLTPVYAFSQRESVEDIQPDGSVIKTNVFRHAGFINGCLA